MSIDPKLKRVEALRNVLQHVQRNNDALSMDSPAISRINSNNTIFTFSEIPDTASQLTDKISEWTSLNFAVTHVVHLLSKQLSGLHVDALDMSIAEEQARSLCHKMYSGIVVTKNTHIIVCESRADAETTLKRRKTETERLQEQGTTKPFEDSVLQEPPRRLFPDLSKASFAEAYAQMYKYCIGPLFSRIRRTTATWCYENKTNGQCVLPLRIHDGRLEIKSRQFDLDILIREASLETFCKKSYGFVRLECSNEVGTIQELVLVMFLDLRYIVVLDPLDQAHRLYNMREAADSLKTLCPDGYAVQWMIPDDVDNVAKQDSVRKWPMLPSLYILNLLLRPGTCAPKLLESLYAMDMPAWTVTTHSMVHAPDSFFFL